MRNPASLAVERKRLETEQLQAEIDALKARIHLLEEGQTKDITMMVGHRYTVIQLIHSFIRLVSFFLFILFYFLLHA